MSFLFAILLRSSQSQTLFACWKPSKILVDTKECWIAAFHPSAPSTLTKFSLDQGRKKLRDWRNWKFTNIFLLSNWEEIQFRAFSDGNCFYVVCFLETQTVVEADAIDMSEPSPWETLPRWLFFIVKNFSIKKSKLLKIDVDTLRAP
jgi:hypothetical protein